MLSLERLLQSITKANRVQARIIMKKKMNTMTMKMTWILMIMNTSRVSHLPKQILFTRLKTRKWDRMKTLLPLELDTLTLI
jgi:hypothetical protein